MALSLHLMEAWDFPNAWSCYNVYIQTFSPGRKQNVKESGMAGELNYAIIPTTGNASPLPSRIHLQLWTQAMLPVVT